MSGVKWHPSPSPVLSIPEHMVVIIVVIWSLCFGYRLEVPHSRGVNPRPPWTRLSNSRKTKGGRTTMTTDPCSQVWITMSGTTTKRWLCRDYPIGFRDATPRRKRLLCAPFNDVSSFFSFLPWAWHCSFLKRIAFKCHVAFYISPM